MESKTIRSNYTMEEVTFTKKTVESIEIAHPRKLRKAQVNNLLSQLKNGEHFDSNLVANRLFELEDDDSKKDRFCPDTHKIWTVCKCENCIARREKKILAEKKIKIRVIDGQHRIEAMKLFFKVFPSDKIKIWWALYRNLTPDEERKVYRKWNIPIKQSTDDFINSFKDEIPFFKEMTKQVPCSIYGSSNKMKIRDLINAHIASSEKPYKGGEKKTTYDFVKYMQQLEISDINNMKTNFEILQEIFNSDNVKDFGKLSAFKNIVFRALYYLVENNKEELGDYLKRRMKTVLVNRAILDQYRRYYGRRASVDAYLAFKNLLNSGQSSKKFE